MPHSSQSILAPYSQKALFELVNDVDDYPNFVPYCSAAQVIDRSEDMLTAELTLSKGPFSESFTTRNTLFPYEKMVLTLVDGPFKKLEGVWTFTEKSDNCTLITLELEYDFNSGLVAGIFGSVFKQAANQFVESFYKRAQEVLG
jgi:ribosome-associated toxin RatA of RatAB toxin-antitoxin module